MNELLVAPETSVLKTKIRGPCHWNICVQLVWGEKYLVYV